MSTNDHTEDMVQDLYADKVREFAEKIKPMTKEELNEELELLEENLEDIQIEKRLILGQTGVHVNAVTVDAYRNSFDREIASTEEMIKLVKEALGG